LPSIGRAGRALGASAFVAVITVAAFVTPATAFRHLYERAIPDAEILHYEEGRVANVVVYDLYRHGWKDLYLNGVEEASSRTWHVQLFKMLGVLPAMIHPDPEDALMIAFGAGSLGPWATLVLVYVVAVLLAELLHHNAAVAIMFPIAVAAAAQVGADPRPFVMAVAVAGCCSFASPVTYQTHLIVYGPGGYRFTDFMRLGLPLDVLCGVISIGLIPLVWPF